ncbi:MAG: acyl-CoA dehydrogenase family protein [Acidobacteriota bacterium]
MLNTPFLEDHHRRLAQQVDRFVRDEIRGRALGETEDEQARHLVRALARERLLAHTVPAQFDRGANSLDVRALCVVRDHLSKEFLRRDDHETKETC